MTEEAIREELERILASSEFARAGYLCRFLRCCVEQTLGGNIAQLKEFWLGRSVFERDKEFNPGADPIVRVQARRMRQKLKAYYTGEGGASLIRIELPVGTYVPRFVAATPAPRSAPPEERVLSLAILPFHDLEQTEPGGRFAAILTSELIHSLVETGQFLVVSRLSSSRYKDSGDDVRAIGRALNAKFLVEGNVRGESGGRQVGVQLTDAESGYHLWSASFPCGAEPGFENAGSLVRRITRLLESRLGEVHLR